MKKPQYYLERDRWNWQEKGEYRFEINNGSIAVFRDENPLKAVLKGLIWYIGYRIRLWLH